MLSPLSSGHGEPGPAPCPFRHVLVGWDGSPDSLTALRTAVAILGNTPGRVTALAVLPQARQPEDGQGNPASASQVWEAFYLARNVAAAGSPARISLHTAHGRHGDGGLLHPRLGHTAEEAARRSPIPVLLVSAS